MPWEPEAHDHGHDGDHVHEPGHDHVHDTPDAEPEITAPAAGRAGGRIRSVRGRAPSTAELHDSVHERRRRAI